MTAATIAAIGIVLYLPVGALILACGLRRIDAAFVRDMHRVLRSRTPGGSGPAPDRRDPQASSGPVAGGEARTPRPVVAALPPAPSNSKAAPSSPKAWSNEPLAGAVVPRHAAPARPPRVMVHG